MKTPKEIKAGLKRCAGDGNCERCNYKRDCISANGFSALACDALAYITQLEKEHKQLMLDDRGCGSCKYSEYDSSDIHCRDCIFTVNGGGLEWRGVCAENEREGTK